MSNIQSEADLIETVKPQIVKSIVLDKYDRPSDQILEF